MSSKYFLLITALAATAAQADQVNLNDVLQEWKSSPRLQKAQSQNTESYWKKVESFSAFLPKIDAKATHYFEQQYVLTDIRLNPNVPASSIPNVIPATIYGIGFNWTLFDGMKNVNQYQAASLFEKASNNDLSWTEFVGEREVVVQYYRALAAQTLKKVAEQNLKVLNDHLHDVELFKKAGISTKFDVLRVDVQSSEARSELMNAEDNEIIELARLNELVGNDSAKTLNGELPILDEKLLEKVSTDNGQRADIAALRLKAEAYSELSDASKAHLLPKVSLIGGYDKYNNRNFSFNSEDFRNAYSIGVQLSWNLFDGFGSMSRDHQATEQKFQSQKNLEIANLKSKTDVDFWKRKFRYYTVVYKARLNDIQKADESVRLAKEGHKVGTRTNTDLLDAEAELFRARAGMVRAQIGAVEALVNFEMATGTKVTQF
jgi:outer membrane protein TolC